MTALMRRMVAAGRIHHLVKACPEAVIRQLLSVIIGYERIARLLHPQLIIGQSFTADWHGTIFASFRL